MRSPRPRLALAALALAALPALLFACADPAACGNGVVEAGEECDDGAFNADDGRCTPQCALPACGDGLVGPGEECDDGELNADDAACTLTCRLAACGDGLVGPGEGCDSPDRQRCTAACEPLLFSDDMENGGAGWTHALVDDPGCLGSFCAVDAWTLTPNAPADPPDPDSRRAWHSGDLSQSRGPLSTRLISPAIDLRDATPPIALRFAHHYRMKANEGIPNYFVDGAIVEVSADDGTDGAPFVHLDVPQYNGQINDRGMCASIPGVATNPLLGQRAFVGVTNTWLSEQVDLSAFAGQVINLGFRIATDCATTNWPETAPVEWFIDDVAVVQLAP